MDPQLYISPIEASFDLAVVQAACGEEHTAILTDQGKVFMMGSNGSG